MVLTTGNKKTLSRREALKIIAASSGAVALAAMPQWQTPLVEIGALPAHAQGSAGTIQFLDGEFFADECGVGTFTDEQYFSYNVPAGVDYCEWIIWFSEAAADLIEEPESEPLDELEAVIYYCADFAGGYSVLEYWLVDVNGMSTNHLVITADPYMTVTSLERHMIVTSLEKPKDFAGKKQFTGKGNFKKK
jgi:hypothetical protein